ncbi:hypothetical protein PC122_g21303 [Phytophthora cactorum]|nr:hypothetical protein PC122_g21303 [Phytophthora cactorum]
MRKEERIEVLKQYGATMTAYGEKLTGDGVQNVHANGDAICSKHCMRCGTQATQSELDSKLINERSEFWVDVQAAFVDECPDNHERNILEFNDDDFFSGI